MRVWLVEGRDGAKGYGGDWCRINRRIDKKKTLQEVEEKCGSIVVLDVEYIIEWWKD